MSIRNKCISYQNSIFYFGSLNIFKMLKVFYCVHCPSKWLISWNGLKILIHFSLCRIILMKSLIVVGLPQGLVASNWYQDNISNIIILVKKQGFDCDILGGEGLNKEMLYSCSSFKLQHRVSIKEKCWFGHFEYWCGGNKYSHSLSP